MAIKLRLDQLDAIAHSRGFPSYKDMLYEHYVVRHRHKYQIAQELHITVGRVTKHLKRFAIPERKKGSILPPRFELTDTLLQEIMRNGVRATAARMHVSEALLRSRLLEVSKRS